MDFNKPNVKRLADAPTIRGTRSFTKDTLQRYDPQYTGQHEIIVIQRAAIMDAKDNSAIYNKMTADQKKRFDAYKIHMDNLEYAIEHAMTSYQGEPELSTDTGTVNVGSQDQQITVHQQTSIDGNSFTITALETVDEPVRHAVEAYLTVLGDPYTKHAPEFAAAGMEKLLKNYTMVIAAVQLDPTLTKIQNITVWEAVQITGGVDRDDLNYTAGEIETIQPKTIQFQGIPRINAWHYLPEVEAVLTERVKNYETWTDISI